MKNAEPVRIEKERSMKYCRRISSVIFVVLFLIGLITLSVASNNQTEDKIIVEKLAEKYKELPIDAESRIVPESSDYSTILTRADSAKAEILRTREAYRFYAVYFFIAAAIASLVIVLVCIKNTQNHNAEDIVNATGLILIIFGTIIVVMIADVEQQLTAAVGILGAIAGYLFGTIRKGKRE